ncbi:LysR substrate-binding domain-containing protein [Arthrobacter sp. UYCu723]
MPTSRQITQLESGIGVALFERHPRGMTLTDAGLLLLSHARRSAAEADALVTELRDLHSRSNRVVKVVSTEGLARCRVPEAIAKFSARHADVVFDLDVVSSAEASRRVVEGTADVGVVYALGMQRDVTVEFSTASPAHAVLGAGSHLADRRSIGVRELCGFPLALPPKGVGQREFFDIAAQMENVRPSIRLMTVHVSPALEFVRAGAGATLLSHLAVHADTEVGLAFIPVDHPLFQQRQAQIQTMIGRRRSSAVAAFIDVLRDSLSEP